MLQVIYVPKTFERLVKGLLTCEEFPTAKKTQNTEKCL
jgi:hypothetical protein